MSTSDWSPLESQDVTALRRLAGTSFLAPVELPSGRVLPADEATALAGVYAAAATSLPVVSGDGVNRSLCCHGRIACPRCTVAELRHQSAIEPHWERDVRRFNGLGVLVFILLVMGLALCGAAYFWTRLPQ